MRMPQLVDAEMLDRIRNRVDEFGDCWIWTGRTHNGTPMVAFRGRDWAVRRVVLVALGREHDLGGRVSVIAACGNPACVSPSCARIVERREANQTLVKRAAQANSGTSSGFARRVKLARSKSHLSKLTDEQVAQIVSGSRPVAEMAREFGVSKTVAYRYARGDSVRSALVATGPWCALLMANKKPTRHP